MAKPAFLTAKDCLVLFNRIVPLVLEHFKAEERVGLHLSLVNPTLTIDEVDSFAMAEDWASVFLWEGSVGDVPEGSPFIENARLKAIEAFRHRETLSAVWANRPWVLRSGDIAWYGGAYHDGLAAGVSGLSETSDEMVCLSFLEDLAIGLRKNAAWPTSQARIAQVREWGGRLP